MKKLTIKDLPKDDLVKIIMSIEEGLLKGGGESILEQFTQKHIARRIVSVRLKKALTNFDAADKLKDRSFSGAREKRKRDLQVVQKRRKGWALFDSARKLAEEHGITEKFSKVFNNEKNQ